MKCITLALSVLLSLTVGELLGSTNLFPGVTLYDYPDVLVGHLAMLVANTAAPLGTNAELSSAIYTFDLKQKILRKLTDVPQFKPLDVSSDGQVFCVCDGPYIRDNAKAFIYSDRLRIIRNISLLRGPKYLLLMSDQAFFVIENANALRLLRYDIAEDKQIIIKLPGSNAWDYEEYSGLSRSEQTTNVLLFSYRAFRKPLSDPNNSTSGSYRYDIATGKIEPVLREGDDKSFTNVARDGRYIFFEGPGAPVGGSRLISSPVDYFQFMDADAKIRANVRTLHRFPARRSYSHYLLQLSPCRKYAFVKQGELVGPNPGTWVYTYYVVDVSNGRTSVLMKDELQLKTGRQMWQQVYWVNGEDR